MIAIINYGVGNINAFVNVYKKLGIMLKVATSANDLIDVSKIILPGVGSFDQAMSKLIESGMKPTIDRMVLTENIPVIGICVGMQMLAHSSEEGILPGLGYIDAKVLKFDESKKSKKLNLPHMGWNDVLPLKGSMLFNKLEDKPLFYFLHSYYFACNKSEDTIAKADYGGEFVCAVNHNNIYGVQFHPEKSHQYGIQLLKNFLEL
ncbi:MAG: imidazole glycerol phosphate synthase subunit HisH [Lentimicrobiaceae bacterium]|jgi:glutamine amidotransferase